MEPKQSSRFKMREAWGPFKEEFEVLGSQDVLDYLATLPHISAKPNQVGQVYCTINLQYDPAAVWEATYQALEDFVKSETLMRGDSVDVGNGEPTLAKTLMSVGEDFLATFKENVVLHREIAELRAQIAKMQIADAKYKHNLRRGEGESDA